MQFYPHTGLANRQRTHPTQTFPLTYGWTFPRDQGGQFFVRLEVVDLAGNVCRCESPMPVMLDMTEPQAQVVGITGGGTPGMQPNGH